MKQFFQLVFGGLAVVFVGIGIAWSSGVVWRTVALGRSSSDQDGTAVFGLLRSIRYSALEEEYSLTESALLSSAKDGKITADAYVIRDLTNERTVAEHDSDKLLPVASLTKLVTAAVARKVIDGEARITLTSQVIGVYGNTAGFRPGETFTADDLMYPLLMVSSNDAAEAYAKHYGRARFIQAMNDFAQRIGAYRTYFADASGLSDLNRSTAADMAIILDWIRLNDPYILTVTTLKSKTVRSHTWTNPAHFLSWTYYAGGKNGYTDAADRTGAMLFTLGDKKNLYAVVVLGSDNRDGDVVNLLNLAK